ncbi:hypothetical protein JRO89_XS05G0218700 [Xanthoceras sorbifolium]|uniref:Tf2-1-like SH3-like domain-containing protein n=1 Tax=Xanthoceras sorbifolium TaxID=99658 RepID=A0ABQ8I2P0_9ROSI|nr:hypothetical protein JRO89_XS05G0218700 [Xanthoceras sorbifolium]
MRSTAAWGSVCFKWYIWWYHVDHLICYPCRARLKFMGKQVYDNLVKNTSKYKLVADKKRRNVEFEVGDFVWVVLTKDCFPVIEYNKLAARKIGLLEVFEKINPNAYQLKLLNHIRTADVFNVKHLMPYLAEFPSKDVDWTSRSTSLHPEGNDATAIEQLLLRN